MKRKSQQGVALVITLILLSVITFMAVTFLVVSRKEASQVNTLTQQANAKFASEAGLEEAKAQIIAQMLATGNGLNFGLLVSTNFISATNFDKTVLANNLPYGAFTNVTYNFNVGATANDYEQMLNNMIILPRVPVFIVTNKGAPNNLDFRYYLDLNRNGRFDTNGLVLNLDSNNVPIPSAINPSFSIQVGDPEWIGILNHPDQRHSSSNLFVARYCFIALPIGNSLDVNFIHNQAQQLSLNLAADGGYLRNQGVGSWEINLAGFLNALNTNYWPTANYNYITTGTPSGGEAFNDAAAIVQYRYNRSYANLRTFANIYNTPADILFRNDYIDGFSFGPLMTNTFPLTKDPDINAINLAKTWSGDNNPNAFFTTQDFYGAIPSPSSQPLLSFTNRLHAPGTTRGTYDRYTYYRMLAQMSFGSAPESSATFSASTTQPYPGYFPFTNRINLNYCNVGVTNATNFQAWTPVQFFTNTANRLLANAGYTNIFGPGPLTVGNLSLYPTNMYTPAVQRLLQLAANIYDASTNRAFTDGSSPNGPVFMPSVFRPTFGVTNNGVKNVFINGYLEDVSDNAANTAWGAIPLSLPEDINGVLPFSISPGGVTNYGTTNIYGVPWIIGAKKYLPNFNEFSMQCTSQVTRKVQVVNLTPGGPPTFQTNAQYTIGISNVLGVEAWNSYTNPYPRAIDLIGADNLNMALTNENGFPLAAINYTNTTAMGWRYTLNPNAWAGATINRVHQIGTNGFQIPLVTNVLFLPDSVYHPNTLPHLTQGTNFDVNTNYLPHFILNMTNRLRFIMVDHNTGRVLDYVQLNGMNITRDLTSELQGNGQEGAANPNGTAGGNGGVWLTNTVNSAANSGMIQGIINQVTISAGGTPQAGFDASGWINDTVDGSSKANAAPGFAAFLNGQGGITNAMQAPYTPTRKVSVYYTWQANDPLIHYTLQDLTPQLPILAPSVTNYYVPAYANTNQYLPNLGLLNQRYLPWGNVGSAKGFRTDSANGYNLVLKDPQITNSDSWQFPTNKFPNVGWLGRVHRGTPWQTVYMKPQSVDLATWQNWTGNTTSNQFFGTSFYGLNSPDAVASTPTNDWTLFDLFTTAPNDNASRGQLSVNQTNLAAWSAVLDGVIAVNNSPAGQAPVFIDPRTNSDAILQIVNGINLLRTNTVAFPGGVFTSVGQILAAPQLTVQSPFLNTTLLQSSTNYPTDAEYERIPQQIMSLLRVGSPRYVIFAYGQSLKPADHSIVQSGPFFGMCTNYAITGEVASRTILRVDNPPIPVPGRALTSPQAVVESFNVLPPE